MTCPDCGDRLQQWLDTRTREAASVPGEPPALCPACAEWSVAARRLDGGLRLLAAPAPPPHLADCIVSQLAAERRFRRVRVLLWAGAAATAATLVLAAWQAFHGNPATNVTPIVQAPAPDSAPATLGDSMTAAGSAVASLTTRTADETAEKTKILLPVVEPSLTKIELPPIDGPAPSLAATGEGVTASLEPVADSARRAVGLFLRELPGDAKTKTGF